MNDASPLITPVLLSGGSGTRMWPLSRESYPKQLLSLAGERTMLQETALRVADRALFKPPLVIANAEHRFVIAEQLRAIGVTDATIVLEPFGRNTTAAAVIAALIEARTDPRALILLLPDDHVIGDIEAFFAAVANGMPHARAGNFVLFGIPPTSPATGYGYIERGTAIPASPGAFRVTQFVEKPDAATALRYFEDGGYLWNSGIFLLPAEVFISEVERLQPAVLTACRRSLESARADLDFLRLDEKAFGASPSISIDYGVIEHTDRNVIVPLDCGWTDVGSWSALWEIGQRDARDNVVIGDVVAEDVSNSYLRGEGQLVAALGVDGLVIVATPDVILVTRRDRDQDVKAIVNRLKTDGHSSATQSIQVHRPWGYYQSVHRGGRFQVKRITVNPGAKLSLQKHFHRAEHWVVVNGTALVTRDNDEILLRENESIFLPLGCVHRLANPGRLPLSVIEVQSGSYLEEDDIVRIEDVYARLNE
jgi:mannose-1-phosphate guanylyltransferase/mannose-6-phosphate isomerase